MRVIFIILYIFQVCYGQDSLVDKYLENIETFEKQSENWVNPVNSYSYIGKHFSSKKYYYDGHFDFIICGAGSAGTVIANRLSEISKWKVLVLEAGSWENNITDIPGMTPYLIRSDFNWGYLSTPQKNGLKGYINNTVYMPRGKVVGGSSVINAMVYARGNKEDYNLWGENNPGWTYDEVLPYFKKSEHVSFQNADLKYHGQSGELNVEYSRAFNQLGEAFLKANEELGRKTVDYNAENEIGASVLQFTQINGKRDSAGKAFIDPIKKRSNLRIYTNTLVTKLLINSRNKETYGVVYLRNGALHYATTKKEVILSAGSINSPQILMLSGIGPREHLESMKISVLQDLPVGDNLWDHLVSSAQPFQINYTYEATSLKQQVNEYLNATGPLTTAYTLQCIGFDNICNDSFKRPDIEYLFNSFKNSEATYETYQKSARYTEETFNSVVKSVEGINQWSLSVLLLHPKSRGTVRLQSASPLDFPLIDPNYFSDSNDAQMFSAAMRKLHKFADTKAMKMFNSTMVKICHPACDCSNWGSDDFWRCMVTHLAYSIYHPAGTAKMGSKCDKTSVVEHTLKVHGIKNLRVADTSVIPVTISGHTNAAAYMIGEKASDLIKDDYCDGIYC